MTDIAAAIGLVQLKKLDDFNNARISNANYLSSKLNNLTGFKLPGIDKHCRHVFHQYTVRVNISTISRDEVVSYLGKKGIGTGIYYPLPIHKQPYYKELGFDDSLPVSEKAASEVFSLPVHPAINEADIDTISKAIGEILL
jgi:perosamine synthetase